MITRLSDFTGRLGQDLGTGLLGEGHSGDDFGVSYVLQDGFYDLNLNFAHKFRLSAMVGGHENNFRVSISHEIDSYREADRFNHTTSPQELRAAADFYDDVRGLLVRMFGKPTARSETHEIYTGPEIWAPVASSK